MHATEAQNVIFVFDKMYHMFSLTVMCNVCCARYNIWLCTKINICKNAEGIEIVKSIQANLSIHHIVYKPNNRI